MKKKEKLKKVIELAQVSGKRTQSGIDSNLFNFRRNKTIKKLYRVNGKLISLRYSVAEVKNNRPK